jgi:HEAT repeat protein
MGGIGLIRNKMAHISKEQASGHSKASENQEELKSVRDLVTALFVALKNHSIYPGSHSVCQKSIIKVQDLLNAFFARHHHTLRLDIQKDRLLYKDEVVHQDQLRAESWIFHLFRDGIQWLEFQEGLDSEEIRGFLKIINSCKKAEEEAEGDLVTALWEANFSGLRYRAVELNWDVEPLNLSIPRVRHEALEGSQGEEEKKEDLPDMALMEHLQYAKGSDLKLTPEEVETLQAMISQEDNRDTAEDLLEVVLAILDDQDDEEVFAEISNFLIDEFKDTLLQNDFHFASKFLSSLHHKRQIYGTEKPWAVPLLDNFFKAISSTEILGSLSETWAKMDLLDQERVGLLRRVLLLLPPEANTALAPMILKIRSLSVQRRLMEIIGILAKRDLCPLERLLERPEDFLVQRVVFIIGRLKSERVDQILRKMTGHPSEQVRKQALKALLARDPNAIEEFFPLIDDPSEAVRGLMLDSLGKARNQSAEKLLLDYLEQRKFRIKDPQHSLACYQTLGRCGSSLSMPFLQGALFNRGWIPDFGKSIQRQGALKALDLLETQEAGLLLEKAGRSLLPGVRSACRKAIRVNK